MSHATALNVACLEINKAADRQGNGRSAISLAASVLRHYGELCEQRSPLSFHLPNWYPVRNHDKILPRLATKDGRTHACDGNSVPTTAESRAVISPSGLVGYIVACTDQFVLVRSLITSSANDVAAGEFVPFHLLFPLFSSVVFVFGVMFAKMAISKGARPWTNTFLANIWLAAIWSIVGLAQKDSLPLEGLQQAALVGLTFVAGQFFTFVAFQYGDVSVVAPLFGIKVIIVAVALAVFTETTIGMRVWIGAILAAVGVGLVQGGARAIVGPDHSPRRAVLAILMTFIAAIALSLFDVGLQSWGRKWGAGRFLPPMFVSTGILSCALLPWVDRPADLRKRGAMIPVLIGTLLMAIQAISMSYALGQYGDAARVNIIYALRGLWAVGLAWVCARAFGGAEARHTKGVMLLRLCGAILLTTSVIVALGGS